MFRCLNKLSLLVNSKMINTCIKQLNEDEQKELLVELDIPKLIEKLILVLSIFHDKSCPINDFKFMFN